MTNIQLYLAIGVPVLAVLVSFTFSLLQVSGIREDLRLFRAEVREDMRTLRQEVREDIQGLRADLNILTGKVIEIDNRLTRIDEQLKHG